MSIVHEPLNFERRYYETIRQASLFALAPRVGRLALADNHYEKLKGYEQRRFDEVESAVVEALRGVLATHYQFELNEDGQLTARDGEVIEHLLANGLDEASLLNTENPLYDHFLMQRWTSEYDEHLENQAMADGTAGFNTNVVISPYNEELATSEENIKLLKRGGQKPQFKRAMLRISHWDGEQLHMLTRSLDNSSVELLKQTAQNSLGYNYRANKPNDILAERIHLNMESAEAFSLADNITAAFDGLLAERSGGVWRQGRPEDDAINIQRQVEANSDILTKLIEEGRRLSLSSPNYLFYKKAFEAKLFDYTALIEARIEQGTTDGVIDIEAAAGAAGALAAAEGKVYDMCGMIISANGETASVATQTGYESLKHLENKKITCPECSSKVVVPKEDLRAGKLTCRDCGYGVDVCTGRVFRKSNKGKERSSRQPDFFDRLSADMEKYTQEVEMGRELARQREQQRLQELEAS